MWRPTCTFVIKDSLFHPKQSIYQDVWKEVFCVVTSRRNAWILLEQNLMLVVYAIKVSVITVGILFASVNYTF